MKLYDWEPTEATNGRKRYTDTSCIKLLGTNLKQQCSICLIIKKLEDICKEEKAIVSDIVGSIMD